MTYTKVKSNSSFLYGTGFTGCNDPLNMTEMYANSVCFEKHILAEVKSPWLDTWGRHVKWSPM